MFFFPAVGTLPREVGNEHLKRIVGTTSNEVAAKTADLVVASLRICLEKQSTASLFLSGGKTPKLLHRELVKRRNRLDWNRILFFFGDERCVPPTHERSNFYLAKQTLFDRLKIKPENIFRMQGEIPPPVAAEKYEEALMKLPSFDVVILGLGSDGHTASLFPGSPVLEDDVRLVRPAQATDGEMRITLTPRALWQAKKIFFMITGKEKSEALFELFSPDIPDPHPARRVLDQAHEATIAFDRAAGSLILNFAN